MAPCWCFWGTAGLCKDLLITDEGSDLDQLRQMGPGWHQLALLDAQGPIQLHVVMFKIIFPCSAAFQLLLPALGNLLRRGEARMWYFLLVPDVLDTLILSIRDLLGR